MESGDQRAKKVVSASPGLQLKITTSAKFPWEVGVAADKYKYKYEKKRGEETNTDKILACNSLSMQCSCDVEN